MRIASLDLGSNTFLLLVAEFDAGKLSKVVREEVRTTRLGQGVHANRKFHPEALQRAEECLAEYSNILKELKPDKIVAMATSAARDVTNSEALFSLGDKYGIPIQIIPGSKEAQISFEGSTFEHKEDKGLLVIDVGGGSTEVIGKNSKSELVGKSLDLGSVRLTEMFITQHPVPAAELEALENYCDKIINENKAELLAEPIKKLIAVAGTPITISLLIQDKEYSHERVHGYEFPIEKLQELRDKMASLSVAERQALIGMDPKRADVIVSGATILLKIAKVFEVKDILVSNHGVRYGVAIMAARGES